MADENTASGGGAGRLLDALRAEMHPADLAAAQRAAAAAPPLTADQQNVLRALLKPGLEEHWNGEQR